MDGNDDDETSHAALPGMSALCPRPHDALDPERYKTFETLGAAQEFIEAFKEADKKGRVSQGGLDGKLRDEAVDRWMSRYDSDVRLHREWGLQMVLDLRSVIFTHG